MRTHLVAWLLALGMICSLSACGPTVEKEQHGSIPSADEAPAADPEPVPEEPDSPDGINPLTGLPMEQKYEKNRPIAVMLNNLKAALPQLGISQADIIYEVPAEGGITRMLGVYQTLEEVGNLGSVRSTRPYYLELALGHDALLVHAGGSPEAYKDISTWGVDNMDGVRGGSDAKIFWRDAQRKKSAGYEHSLLTSGEAVLEYLAGGRYRTEHKEGYSYTQTFAEDATPRNGAPAEHLTINFSKYKSEGTFDFDAASGKYLAGQYGIAYIDGNTGDQPGFTNVLVLNTSIYTVKGDQEGRQSVKLTGEGEGTFFCGGKASPIRWSKKDRNSPFVYSNQDGTPLVLGAGTSYICIINPKMSTLTYQ